MEYIFNKRFCFRESASGGDLDRLMSRGSEIFGDLSDAAQKTEISDTVKTILGETFDPKSEESLAKLPERLVESVRELSPEKTGALKDILQRFGKIGPDTLQNLVQHSDALEPTADNLSALNLSNSPAALHESLTDSIKRDGLAKTLEKIRTMKDNPTRAILMLLADSVAPESLQPLIKEFFRLIPAESFKDAIMTVIPSLPAEKIKPIVLELFKDMPAEEVVKMVRESDKTGNFEIMATYLLPDSIVKEGALDQLNKMDAEEVKRMAIENLEKKSAEEIKEMAADAIVNIGDEYYQEARGKIMDVILGVEGKEEEEKK